MNFHLVVPAHVLLALQDAQRLHENYARKFVPDDEYGQLSREAIACIWKELAPVERPDFITRYIQWQENAPRPIFKDSAALNAYQMIEWARHEYNDNARPLSEITAMSLDDLKARANAPVTAKSICFACQRGQCVVCVDARKCDCKHKGLMLAELQDRISIAVNTCKDVTTLGRFAVSVDPVRWVEGLQALLEDGM